MTAITQNLPWFLRDPATALIGEKCYRSLVEELHVDDYECLKYALSKGLGLGIVVGGSIVKVPQVFIIMKARSARGLSFASCVLETLAYAITLAYSYRNEFPFSTYGENLFLTVQNALITVLIAYYPVSTLRRAQVNTGPAAATLLAILAGSYGLTHIPTQTLSLLQVATLPLSVFSKLPQIMQNYRSKSTGQLSAFAVGSQIAGCLARLFTTATEVGDSLLFLGFALALVLNCVLGTQIWMYWDAEAEAKNVDIGRLTTAEKEKAYARPAQVDIIVPPSSPGPSGRRWARKVD